MHKAVTWLSSHLLMQHHFLKYPIIQDKSCFGNSLSLGIEIENSFLSGHPCCSCCPISWFVIGWEKFFVDNLLPMIFSVSLLNFKCSIPFSSSLFLFLVCDWREGSVTLGLGWIEVGSVSSCISLFPGSYCNTSWICSRLLKERTTAWLVSVFLSFFSFSIWNCRFLLLTLKIYLLWYRSWIFSVCFFCLTSYMSLSTLYFY